MTTNAVAAGWLRPVYRLGRTTLALIAGTGNFALFSWRAIRVVPRTRGLRQRWMRAVAEQGTRCASVILIVALFTGLVLGLQGFHVLARFNSQGLLGNLVALTLTRELAPVLAALMIVAQAGSALAAELGLQRNSEQIDALGTMQIDPLGYLIAPRLLAAVVTFPMLTVFFALVGTFGGYLSGSLLLGVDKAVYWTAVHDALQPGDFVECLLKSVVFGFLTIAICSFTGFNTHLRDQVAGARAISASTTRAVVLASISVVATDYLITSLLV